MSPQHSLRLIALAPCIVLLGAADPSGVVGPGSPAQHALDTVPPVPVLYSPDLMHHGGGSLLGKAAADTFYLYGGPGSLEGKFQTSMGTPEMQGWTGHDLTNPPNHWHVGTFNSPTGTPAVWCGRDEAQEPGWVTAPGYGNNWNANLEFHVPVSNAAQPTTVEWSFLYNHDTEPAYDYFLAEYLLEDSWTPLLSVDGTNKDTSGVFVPEVAAFTFVISPESYSGAAGDEVALRFAVTSDGGWSDEDGLWPTDGAAQIDNVSVDLGLNGGSFFDDFDSSLGNWVQGQGLFAGDFSKVLPRLADLDPCRGNQTPQVAFIDDGTPPRNAPGKSTGGSVSANWTYGPEGYVVNYTGGVSEGTSVIHNEVWSPEIDFDLPDGADDAAIGAVFLRFDRWIHLPFQNGLFAYWHVRTFDGAGWSNWVDNNFVYYSNGFPFAFERLDQDVSRFIEFDTVQKLQVALGVIDLADLFALPGTDATPAPYYDNVSVVKARAAGPTLSVLSRDFFQGGFSHTAVTVADYDGPSGPNDELQFALRVDAAANIVWGFGAPIIPGDSLTATVTPVVPGTALAGLPQLKYRLFANPAFDHVRDVSVHDGQVGSIAGPGGSGSWNVWHGAAMGDSTRRFDRIVEDAYSFDVDFDGPFERNSALIDDPPEPAGFFPGDWLFYYVEANDTGGNTTTIPRGLGAGSPPNDWPLLTLEGGAVASYADLAANDYDRSWRIRGLPGIDLGGGHPEILFIDDASGLGDNEWTQAWRQNGFVEGIDYDEYVVVGSSISLDNGIGGVHGASAEQMTGYSCLFYDSDLLTFNLLSDGLDFGGNDLSEDQQVLTAWHSQDADRYSAYFGDHLATWLDRHAGTYLQDILGVDVGAGLSDVSGEIGDQQSPVVAPTAAAPGAFTSSYIAFGGCLTLNNFDHLEPLAFTSAVASHEFLDPSGAGGAHSAAAGVWFDRTETPDQTPRRRVDLTFPFGLRFVRGSGGSGLPAGRSARAVLLGEILTAFGHPASSPPTAMQPRQQPARLDQNVPNPFNPTTTVSFFLAKRGRVSLRVLDLRGRVVRTLVQEVREAGDHVAVFDGRDDSGAALASGIYLTELNAEDRRQVRKMALLK